MRAIRIYVGNLPYQVSEQELRELFAAHGEVGSVDLPWDHATGRPKGFGFVEMPNNEQAAAAVTALNGFSVGGRNIVVNEARPMAPRHGPPGGGFRSEGGGSGGGGGYGGGGYGAGGGRGRKPEDKPGKSSWDRNNRRRKR